MHSLDNEHMAGLGHVLIWQKQGLNYRGHNVQSGPEKWDSGDVCIPFPDLILFWT